MSSSSTQNPECWIVIYNEEQLKENIFQHHRVLNSGPHQEKGVIHTVLTAIIQKHPKQQTNQKEVVILTKKKSQQNCETDLFNGQKCEDMHPEDSKL